MIDNCIIPDMAHNWEWIVAAHGVQVFQCTLCHQIQDVVEDSQA